PAIIARAMARSGDAHTGDSRAPDVRTVDVRGIDARRTEVRGGEGFWAAMFGGIVVVGVIYLVAVERFGLDGPFGSASRRADGALPYQVLFRDLPSAEQRVYGQLREGVTEAIAARGASGDWPSVESLAEQGIPPFARDVLDKAG